jgi:predicted dehydrogenase
VTDTKPSCHDWFAESLPTVRQFATDYRELLANPDVDAVYVAVPHNVHATIYGDAIRAGKHLLGEKPWGIDLEANQGILRVLADHPGVFARCSSQFPYFPAVMRIIRMIEAQRFGRIIEVDAGFWHSSDLDPNKPINWKRQVSMNGEYGCMGDLGMHVFHIPLRFGWMPRNVRGLLSKIVAERPGPDGKMVPCETWDNAVLACEAGQADESFPMLLSMKRIAPGEANTWFLRIHGTELSAEFTTKYPKTLRTMPYRQGQPQSWEETDVGYVSAYPAITGPIFEFGFSDAILQMVAAFCDELTCRDQMQGPFACATPAETQAHHRIMTAALESQRFGGTVALR